MTSRLSRYSCAFICAFFCCIASAGGRAQSPQAQPEDSTLSVLMSRLDTYVAAIEAESTPTKNTESDFLISACALLQHLTLKK